MISDAHAMLLQNAALQNAMLQSGSPIAAADRVARIQKFNHTAERMLSILAADLLSHPPECLLAQQEDPAPRAPEWASGTGLSFAQAVQAPHRATADGEAQVIKRAPIAPGPADQARADQARVDQGRVDQGRVDQGRVGQGRADQAQSAFLAKMSHELRTPLNSIIGFTGIVMKGLSGPVTREQSKQLGMVRDSARHLLAVVNDLLDFAKLESGQLHVQAEPFSLRSSIERVVTQMRPLAEKRGLVLTAVVAPAIGTMWSDQRRVEQILLSLVDNAIKFTDRGHVALAADLVPGDMAPGLAAGGCADRPDALVRLRVADTGIGMQSEHVAALFQPFHQVSSGLARQYEGVGLGLALARRLAALLGGDISVASEWLKGSEFTAIIPVQMPCD